MPTPQNIKAGAVIGAFQGTNPVLISSTPVDVWGWSVWNGESSVQKAGISETTSSVLTLPYAAGHSHVPGYGYKVNSLAAKVDHTNSAIFVFYTPYQQ